MGKSILNAKPEVQQLRYFRGHIVLLLFHMMNSLHIKDKHAVV